MPETAQHTKTTASTSDTDTYGIGHAQPEPSDVDDDQQPTQRPQQAAPDDGPRGGERPIPPGARQAVRTLPSASIRTVAVTDIRTVLAYLLADLKQAGIDAIPVLIARHRDPMAVLISIEQFHEYCDFTTTQVAENG